MLNKYTNEIEFLSIIRDAGVVRPYRSRDSALKQFVKEIENENSEIYIVGSSLKGLLQQDEYKSIRNTIKDKIQKEKVRVKFLLTHPMFADLRAGQEARRPRDIGEEIIESLQILNNWEVNPDNIRLYKGTPTCFAIKTSKKMFLNTYPYGEVAYDSPCLIVQKFDNGNGYFFSAYEKSHFGVWDKDTVEEISDLNGKIQDLNFKMAVYSDNVEKLLNS